METTPEEKQSVQGIDPASFYGSRYESTTGEFAFSATTLDEFHAWQNAFRPELFKALGLHLMAEDCKGHQPWAERIKGEDKELYMLEWWRIWVEPDVPLPFFLLRPKNMEGPLPLVLTPHGHNHPQMYAGLYDTEDQRRSMLEGDRDIAVQAVKEGYIVIAPTTRGFGDTRFFADIEQKRLSSCRVQLLHGLLLGRTAIGERVWDMSRLLDWAIEHLDIDTRCIAITGNSGGGTVSVFAAAIDTRFTVAVPGSYFCTFADSIGSIHHCECNYVPGILRLGEMHDVAGLIAPRPFCAVNGVEDPIFPIDATRYAYKKLKEIYAVAGVAEKCQLYEGAGGHRFYKEGAWPFMRKHFDALITE